VIDASVGFSKFEAASFDIIYKDLGLLLRIILQVSCMGPSEVSSCICESKLIKKVRV